MQVAKNIQAVLAGKPLKAWKPNGGFSVSRWNAFATLLPTLLDSSKAAFRTQLVASCLG